MPIKGTRKETADEFTDKFKDSGKRDYLVFASYWDEWKHKQAKKNDTEDLYLKLLLGKGDRPDLGAGLVNLTFTGDMSPTPASSGSSNGFATTGSNLTEIKKTKPIGGNQNE